MRYFFLICDDGDYIELNYDGIFDMKIEPDIVHGFVSYKTSYAEFNIFKKYKSEILNFITFLKLKDVLDPNVKVL